MNLKWFRERWSHVSIFLWRLLLTQCPLNILMSHEILPVVAHNDLKDQCYLRLILKLKIAPQLKGLFHAICYLFRKLQFSWTPKIMVQLCYLLPPIARMGMDWNVKKLRQRLQVLMLYRQNHKNIIMVSAFWWNLLSSSSHLYKSILCMGKHTKYHRNIALLKRLFSPVYTSPDKHLNGKNVHGSAFRLHGTRGTKQIFERQTVLQCVKKFEQFRVNRLHR